MSRSDHTGRRETNADTTLRDGLRRRNADASDDATLNEYDDTTRVDTAPRAVRMVVDETQVRQRRGRSQT